MNYSAINHLEFRIGLKKEMFVIGGVFAAGLCEPVLARNLGDCGDHVRVFTTSHNFEILKGYEERGMRTVLENDDLLRITSGSMSITVVRGMPVHWVNDSGYLVQHPTPLKYYLEQDDCAYLAKALQEVPFPKRMEGWTLTAEEQAFKEACSKHDWYSDYSDDFQVVKNGKVGLNVLLAKREAIGGKAGEIFSFYANS